MPDVNIAGHEVPRGAVVISLLGILGIGGYELYRHATKAVTTPSDTSSPGTSYGYGYGYGYGSGSYGYGQYYAYGTGGEEYYGYGPYGYGYYSGAGQYLGTGYPTSTGTPPVSTNSAWAQQAVSSMADLGYTTTTVATALGLYLSGKEMSAAQGDIVTTAIGLVGDPPQAGANGYPPAMHVRSSTTTPKSTATVPNVTGERVDIGAAKLTTAGFKPHIKGSRSPHDAYVITSTSPRAGTKAAKGSTVTINFKKK